MYICLCNAVSDHQIMAAVAAGARSLGELSLTLGVGAGCGCCRATAQEYIRSAGRCDGDCESCPRSAAPMK